MIRLLLLILVSSLSYAGVTMSGGASWNGTTATGGSRPYTYTVTCTGGIGSMAEAQLVADDAYAGDTILFSNGCEWQGSSTTGGMRIHPRRGGTGNLIIQSTEFAKLPNSGTRITPVYKPLLPIFRSFGNGGMQVSLRTTNVIIRGIYFADHVRSEANWFTIGNYKGLLSVGGVFNWNTDTELRTSGIGFHLVSSSSAAGQPVVYMNDTAWASPGMRVSVNNTYSSRDEGPKTILSVQPGVSITLTTNLTNTHPANDQVEAFKDSDADLPSNITVQHCIFDTEWLFNTVRHVGWSAKFSTFRDNYTDHALIVNGDSQSIVSDVGHDNLFENNHIGYGSENWMSGGQKPDYDSQQTDTLFRFNSFAKYPERDRAETWDQVTYRAEGRTVWKGRFVTPSAAFDSANGTSMRNSIWFQAQNSGVVCQTEPNWLTTAALNDMKQDCGVTWRRMNGNHALNKNNFETKSGVNITVQYNSFSGFTDGYANNQAQPAVIAIKAASYGAIGCNDGTSVWPDCYRARTRNIKIINNFIDNFVQLANLIGGQNRKVEYADTYLFENNFAIMREPVKNTSGGPSSVFQLGPTSYTIAGVTTFESLDGVRIRHNTVIAPPGYTTSSGAASVYVGGSSPYTSADFSGNILPRQATGLAGDSAVADGSSSGVNVPANRFPATSLGGILGKNIIVGSPSGATNYQGQVYGNCPTTGSCTMDWDYDDVVNRGGAYTGGYRKLFRNFLAGDYFVRPTHGYARRAMNTTTGKVDMGADMSQIPRMQYLTVTPTATAALFRYRVSPVMVNTPCVWEVAKTPDFKNNFTLENGTTVITAGYAGELSDPDTYYRRDADDYQTYLRRGLNRMYLIGSSVPLTPATTYYYRVQCAGDQRRGSFTTSETMTGTTTLSYTFEAPVTGTYSLRTGFSYNRSLDTAKPAGSTANGISNTIVDTGSVSCTAHTECTVTQTVNRGYRYYYSWKRGTTLGPARVILVQQ